MRRASPRRWRSKAFRRAADRNRPRRSKSARAVPAEAQSRNRCLRAGRPRPAPTAGAHLRRRASRFYEPRRRSTAQSAGLRPNGRRRPQQAPLNSGSSGTGNARIAPRNRGAHGSRHRTPAARDPATPTAALQRAPMGPHGRSKATRRASNTAFLRVSICREEIVVGMPNNRLVLGGPNGPNPDDIAHAHSGQVRFSVGASADDTVLHPQHPGDLLHRHPALGQMEEMADVPGPSPGPQQAGRRGLRHAVEAAPLTPRCWPMRQHHQHAPRARSRPGASGAASPR